ncbi:bifunctional sugar phosphate isomerase/epimerase/4-hydroxyphenylpyruvate dioxygenase family protein [Nesterenkonia sphaerica]|uniref:3-dehydroshikimate dehydratase n=1 Tax=Nesterenkonia sphaerica TaxID=1804988 RepID=A0A5R9APY4_9MICC|nr:sugar phosphate isomerase/epimerase and 4-hydroxyphenylpyruvate domain-containing protein [Nesterenkonia sphaerica]TLP79945.1 sugar phosphate isomerase/epimerase and 4-hydroxyphenylpyruvate domain-containing protein [Nesterenkonia sphaerica]
MVTSIATVSLSGGLTEKLQACAKAGFDGVEVMDADLTVAYESPEEIRALCHRLGLKIDMLQPLRDAEGVDEATFADNLRRAREKFRTMNRLGTDLLLVCSNAGTATVDDDAVVTSQLGQLADAAAEFGVRIAYEALAWGRFVNDYRHAWRLVEAADRPNLGTCLDSFHILSRGHDPAGIEEIDGEKIFFLQLADAPQLEMDLLSWSRHHRLFPGEGAFDLTGFLKHVLRAGYRGPLSLEVFNDTFRQTDVYRTAAHAQRALIWLADQAGAEEHSRHGKLPAGQPPQGFDFVEIAGADLSEVDQLMNQLGFTFRGRHRRKPVRLWSLGEARIILNEQRKRETPQLAALGLEVAHSGRAADRAQSLGAAPVFRNTSTGEFDLRGVAAPDGTEIFWNGHGEPIRWIGEFEGGMEPGEQHGGIDHVNLSYPWQHFDEAVLFATSALGLEPAASAEVPGPLGLVRSQVMHTADRKVRVPLNLAPPTAPVPPRHVALQCADIITTAARARSRGLRFLPVPDNYYDDLTARLPLDPDFVSTLKELDLLYDRDGAGDFIHFYTPTIGEFFFEIVERRGDYAGYGAPNAPVRLAAQRALTATQSR